MKHTFHIATGQYEFLEQEFEGTTEEAVEAYKELQGAWKGGEGLPQKEWNEWLDSYLAGKPGSIDDWNQMSDFQKQVVNEIKKSRKRTN